MTGAMANQQDAPAQTKTRRAAEQRRRVLQIAQELSATLGTDFFQSVVKHLASAFQADCAYLAELTGASMDRIRTLAVFREKDGSSGFEQPLSGSAASYAIAGGSVACSKEIQLLFPEDDLIASMEAEGFVGLRLSDSAGQAIGLLAIASRTPFVNIHLVKSVMEAFVPRAAAELERKRREDLRLENEQRHQAFISSNPDAMWRIEMEQPVLLSISEEEQIDRVYRFGYLAECNQAMAPLAGVESGDELVGMRFGEIAELIHSGAREELREALRSGFRSIRVETTPTKPGGELVHRLRTQFGIVEDGSLRRIWGMTRDITELRRTELSLAASQRRFREVLQGIHLPAVMLDLEGAITFANECFLQLAQRSQDDAASPRWLEGIVPEAESGTWKRAMETDDLGRRAGIHFEGSIQAKNGPPKLIAWDTIGLSDENGEAAGVAALGRDITRQRALEFQLREAQKLESVGRLAAGVAHDFNNMLTVILGYTTLLLKEHLKQDPTNQRLTAIETAATQCARLSSQLLAFGRQQYLRPDLISLNEVILSDEQIIRGLLGDRIELLLNLALPLGRVYADAVQLHRAIANLVTNARDAMPDGGRVTIETANVEIQAEDPDFPRAEPGRYVRLSVTDSGTGLTDEVRGRMFEPFFTTKPPGMGTGLGLSTVYGIVLQSGGHIAVHSEPGKGARFAILLPENATEA
ncbi:MAG: ATP-binding protein [Candidatus Solibacter sp.]